MASLDIRITAVKGPQSGSGGYLPTPKPRSSHSTGTAVTKGTVQGTQASSPLLTSGGPPASTPVRVM